MGLFKAGLRHILPVNEAQQHRPDILLVEYESHSLEVLSSLLEERYTVHTARNAGEALHLLESMQDSHKPRVLISCQRMPLMTGTELFSCVQERWPNIRCILITGYSTAALGNSTEDGFRLLCKPIDSSQLLKAISEEMSTS